MGCLHYGRLGKDSRARSARVSEGRQQSMLLPIRKLRVTRTQLLSECAIYLQVNMAMLHSLWLVPPAHLGQHLGGLEAIGCARLLQTSPGCVDDFCENANEFVPRQEQPVRPCARCGICNSSIGLATSSLLQPWRVLWTWVACLRKGGLSCHAARYELGEPLVFRFSQSWHMSFTVGRLSAISAWLATVFTGLQGPAFALQCPWWAFSPSGDREANVLGHTFGVTELCSEQSESEVARLLAVSHRGQRGSSARPRQPGCPRWRYG